MVSLQRDGGTVQVRPTPWERLAGLLPPLDVPVTAVVSLEVVQDPLPAARGFRMGLHLPGVTKIGRYARSGELSYVSVRRGEPAVRVHLTGQHFRTLLVSTPDADRIVDRLLQPA